ncbi:hypothetical protein LCGC14_2412090 [marine sediment metagenome]|uniref:Uncharacterized protein n=1 Tax=marine sediment metagenome TaxID=412755 RepID=A0A0F9BS91_9ZZZZ
MSSSKPVAPSRPFHSKECKNFRFIAFWSKKITNFVDHIEKTGTNARVTHHDLLVNFVNEEYLDGAGELDHEKRVKGSKHDDLSLPSKVIEFKFRSSALTSLPGVLRNAKDIFTRNNFLYFAYFRRRIKKDQTKIIKTRGCIYYLIIIIFPKEIEQLNLKALLKEIRKEEMEFTKEVAQKSGIDMDDEELYAVGNMIKEIKLERKLEEKDKIIEEKDKIIKRMKKQLNGK